MIAASKQTASVGRAKGIGGVCIGRSESSKSGACSKGTGLAGLVAILAPLGVVYAAQLVERVLVVGGHGGYGLERV